MLFWLVVLAALFGVPFLLVFTGMAMVFAIGGLAGGPMASRATTIVRGWLALACVLVSVFGAFGLVPAWRAWQGGDEDFAGGLRLFVDWLLGTGVPVLLVAGTARVLRKR